MLLRVVHEDDVDAVEPEALEALVERGANPERAEIEDRADALRLRKRRCLSGGGGAKQPADLRREHELVAWLALQHRADEPLRSSVAVQRRDVEQADAAIPGALDHRRRGFLAHRLEQAAVRPAADAEPRRGRRQRHSPGATTYAVPVAVSN